MMSNEKLSERLFSYGTLQQPDVQLATFGRELDGTADALTGYRLRMIWIDDSDFIAASGTADHRNLEITGDSEHVVEGTVFAITRAELEQADAYEPAGYERHLIQLRSGLNAWVYSAPVPSTADPS